MRTFKLLLFVSLSCLALATSSRADVPVVVDVIPPTNSVVSALTQIEVFFSEDVQGVDAADLLVNGVAATDVTFGLPNQALFRFIQPANGTVTISWALDHGIQDLSFVPNDFAGGGWTYTLNPAIAPPTIVINEFLANNSGYSAVHPNNIRDEDGDPSDWIELFNAGALSVNLDGWYLTDTDTNLTKWRLPAVTMLSSNYMVIFASNKDRTNATNVLHTNFKLSTSPSFLALVKPGGTNLASDFSPRYPQQSADVSYGRAVGMLETVGFFSMPTPGKVNSTAGSGFAPDVIFSLPSMTFTGSFQLALSLAVPNPNVEIRYTLNGAMPTNSPGAGSLIYMNPLSITNTARVRARAFQAGFFPSPPHSEHYIALASNVLAYTTDLPIIILHNFGGGAVPSGSDQPMFMSVHEPKNGVASLTNAPDLTARGIFHLRGSSTLGYAKGSFHLETQDEFGTDKHVPLLGMPAQSDWVFYAPNNFEPILIHNPLAYDLSRQIGRYASRTRFAVVYLKDDAGTPGPVASAEYNGIYAVEEQIKRDKNRVDIDEVVPEDVKPPNITGGYIFSIDRGDGSTPLSAGGASMNWIDPHGPEMAVPQRKPQRDYLAKYFNDFQTSLTGNGWTNRTTGFWAYLDVDAAIDHSVHNVFTFNVDALRLSGYFYKPRNGKITYGPVWDFDRTENSTDGRDQNPRVWRSATGDQGTDFFGSGSQPWWDRFCLDPDFWQKWIDRWQELRKPGMPFHNATVWATVDKHINQVRHEQPREFAKWGSMAAPRQRGTAYPHETNYNGTYQGEVNALKAWFADRGNFFDTNFLAQPVLSSGGGPITPGFTLTMTIPVAGTDATTNYYTLDGTDPRAPGGAISPNALPYTGGPIVISTNARVVARAFNASRRNLRRIPAPADPGSGNPQISSPWSGPAAATFVVTTPKLIITEIMYHPADPPAGSPYTSDDFEYIELKNTGPDTVLLGGIQLGSGIQFTFDPTRYETPGANTVQNFDGGGTAFASSLLGVAPGATVTPGGPRGSFMRLVSQTGGKNRIAFDKTASGPYDQFTADFDFRGTTAGPAITTGTPTIQNFEVAGTSYTLSNYNGALASVLTNNTPTTNRFLRLTPSAPATTTNTSNVVVFDRTATGTFNLVVATFDFRINPLTTVTNAPGMGFAFLNTATYGATGDAAGNLPGFAEEPNLPDAIGVGFDTVLDQPASPAEPNNNHVSLHYNGAQVSPAAATPSFDFSNNQFHRAQVMIRFADGNAFVTVRLTQNVSGTNLPPETLFENFLVPGVAPFEGRIAFGARTSNKLAQQDVDNVSVEYFNNVPTSAGLSMQLLPTATFGAAGTGSRLADFGEEPKAPGVFAIDLTMNPSAYLNHVAAYWNGNQSANAFVPPASLDLDSGVFHHAHLEVTRAGGASTVNLTLTPNILGTPGSPVTVLSSYVINGLDLGDSRIELAGRAGGLNVGLDLDNLTVQYLHLIPNALAAGERLVLVKNAAAFQSRYGTSIRIGGEYTSSLNNGGDRLTLVGALGEPILDFTFQDNWYPTTDGSGFALVIRNENAPLNSWANAASWRPSTEPLGSPGTPGAVAPNLPVVYVNEALAHTLLPDLDKIELYNPSNAPVDISGWYLTDDFNKPRKFHVPAGTSIAANSYKVYSELDFNAGPNAFALNSKGDSVYLFSGTVAGDLTGYVHGFDFGATPLGATLGRHVTSLGEDHFVAQISPTLDGVNAGPLIGPVVVSEIMYRPADLVIYGNFVDNRFDEFIELKNITGGPVNLFDSDHSTNTWRLRDAVSFHFPTNVTLPAGGFALVVSFDPADPTLLAAFRARFSVPAGAPVFGPWDGHLDNSSASVELTRPDAPVPPPATDAGTVSHILVDKVRYSADVPPWSAADGTLLSLQRINPATYGNDPINWTAAGPSAGVSFLGGAVPVITASPTNQTVIGFQGRSATFSVSATSPTSLGYQWQFNGVNLTDVPGELTGATSPSLTVNNITADDAGGYQAVVYNGGGFAFSDVASLTVLVPANITRQPATQIVKLGTNVTFRVDATSTTPLRYQWKYNGADIPNATNFNYVINNVQVSHEGNYSVVVTDNVGSVPSAVAQLTVLVLPVFTQQPQSVIAVQGDTVNFSASLSTTSHPLPLSYKWRKDGATLGHRPPATNIVVNDFSSTLTLLNVQFNQAGKYTLLITNLATSGVVSDNSVALTVLADADGDHLPDEWEIANFLNLDADGAQDPDHDGFTNLQEYLAGTDPNDDTSYLKVDSITSDPGTATLTFIARSNKTYTVLFKNSLSDLTWQNLSNLFARATNRVETVTDPTIGSGSRVYRLVTPYSQ